MITSDAIHDLELMAGGAECFLDIADDLMANADFEGALKSIYIAATLLKLQNRRLVHPRLESQLNRVGTVITERSSVTLKPCSAPSGKQRWLHVLTEALPSGGHTAMALRWIKNDRVDRVHSVALVAQKSPPPVALAEAVAARGGSLYQAETQTSWLARAEWLRRIAHEQATHVVLHIDVDDVVSAAAFSVAGGPLTMMVNHAAHIFWVGASIVDLVINCRGSQLEQEWTRIFRGVSRSATIPIPLEIPAGGDAVGRERDELRMQARKELGIAENELMILTSGASFKYLPLDEMDFLATGEEVLRAVPEAVIVAIGPKEDARWQAASQRTGGRLRTFGLQPAAKVIRFQQAADLYIEGFPFGSTTALLEAGLWGLPAVLAPMECPPPYGTDGVAIDDWLERPASLVDYCRRVVELARDRQLREQLGKRLRTAILQHHTGDGWFEYLGRAIANLPARHSVYAVDDPVLTPERIHLYWAKFARVVYPVAFPLCEHAVSHAFTLGVRPPVSPQFPSNGAGPKNNVRAQIDSDIGDAYYARGEHDVARQFYRRSLAQDPGRFRTRVKQMLLVLGPLGDLIRRRPQPICVNRNSESAT